MMQRPMQDYSGMPHYDTATGLNLLNSFIDTTFREVKSDTLGLNTMRTFFQMTDLPGRNIAFAPILIGMTLARLHPINLYVLPLYPTDVKTFEIEVKYYQNTLLTRVPELGVAVQTGEVSTMLKGKMDRYGACKFMTSDMKNTMEGRESLNRTFMHIVSITHKTFAMVALQYLIAVTTDRVVNTFYDVADRHRYDALQKYLIENFAIANKRQEGLMELVCNMRQMMHDESGVEPNYFIVPQSKTAALIKSNPLYTRYKEGGQEAVDTLKSPLEPEIDFNGVKLMNAPDYKSIDNQFSQVSMKRRYTVGRYEPLTNDADCDPTKIPEVSIFDLYRGGDYKAFTLLDVFAHSGRFKKSLDDPELWVFDVETYRMTCPGLPIGNLEVFETDNPDPFMVKVEGGYSWHPHLFNENNNPQERTMDEWCQCFMTNDRNFQSLNTKRESMTDAKQNFDSTSNQLQVVIDQYNYYQSLFPLNGDIADQQINGVKNLAKIDVNFEIQNLEGLDALCLRYILHILNFEPFLQTPVYVDHERYLLIAFILYIQDIPTPQVDANILGNEVNWLNVIRRIFEAAPGGNRRTPIQEYINQLAGNNPDFADLLNQARVDDFNNVRDLLVALIALAIPDHPEINTTIRRMINVGKFFVVANEQYRMTTQYKQLKTLYEEAETTYNESKNKTNRSGLSALLFRPFDSGYVDMGLMVRGGPDLGFVAHSPEFFEAGSDPTNSSHTLDFRVWIGPFIKEMRFVKRADSVYYSGILYGSGTKIIDNDARRRLMNENFRLTNPDDPCLYVILFPTFNFDDNNLKKRRFEDPPKRLHIVGKRDVDTEESNLGDYPGWDFYSKYYGWQNFQTSFNHENCPIASYVCKGSYFYPTNSYGGIHKVPGETHHGPNEGSYSVRIRESGVGIIPV